MNHGGRSRLVTVSHKELSDRLSGHSQFQISHRAHTDIQEYLRRVNGHLGGRLREEDKSENLAHYVNAVAVYTFLHYPLGLEGIDGHREKFVGLAWNKYHLQNALQVYSRHNGTEAPDQFIEIGRDALSRNLVNWEHHFRIAKKFNEELKRAAAYALSQMAMKYTLEMHYALIAFHEVAGGLFNARFNHDTSLRDDIARLKAEHGSFVMAFPRYFF